MIRTKTQRKYSGTSRRQCIQALACGIAAAGGAPLPAVDFEKPVPGSDKLTAYQNDGLLVVRWNNDALCTYRAQSSQKYPYFHPLTGPLSGLPLTTESALPYPHQRGLFLGLEPLNGGDYWTDGPLGEGQIRSHGLKLGAVTATSATFTDRCDWLKQEAPSPLRDVRTFTVNRVSDRVWTLDSDFSLQALEDITIKSAKHSLFTLRSAPDLTPLYGGHLVSSTGGKGATGTYGKQAGWCSFFGSRAKGTRGVEGITMMDHPANPWYPCVWMTRDYGSLTPSPFNFLDKPWTLPKGATLRLRYRIVAHAGSPKEAGIERIWQEWASSAPRKQA